MKRVITLNIIILILLLIVTGCSDKKYSADYNNSVNDSLDTQENNEKKLYDIEQFPEIKNISDDFINLLNKNTVTYKNITYEIGNYTDSEYKTVNIILNEDEDITMKFSDDGKLLLLKLYGGISETPSIDYENSKLSMLQFNYYKFSDSDIINALSSVLKNEDYRIGNYKISGTQYPSWNMFFIADNVNN